MLGIFGDYIGTKESFTISPDVHGRHELGELTHLNTCSDMKPSPLHYHSEYMEVHCVIGGVFNSEAMEAEKKQSYLASGNEVFIVMPFELHSDDMYPQKTCEIYVCQVSIQDSGRILNLNSEYSILLYERLSKTNNRHWYLSKTDLVMVRTAFNLIANGDDEDRKNGVQALAGFLFNLHYMIPIEDKGTRIVDEKIKRSIDYVDQHIAQLITVETLAQISGYSVPGFKMKFKQEVGYAPAEYVSIQKVKASKRLLEDSEVSIAKVAYELGFSSGNYFSTVFKKIMGSTPCEYRKQFKRFHSLN